MSPLGGLIRRVLGGAPEAATRGEPASSAQPAAAGPVGAEGEDERQQGRKRRRGRRGGRGRGRGRANGDAAASAAGTGSGDASGGADRQQQDRQQQGGQQQGGQTDDQQQGGQQQGRQTNDQQQAKERSTTKTETRNEQQGTRETAGGRRRGGRDTRDGRRDRNSEAPRRRRWGQWIPRSALDAPLPEDIAFRPAGEGGDGTILPGRRRPPPGPRTTERVLVPGITYVPRDDIVRDAEPPPGRTAEPPTREGAPTTPAEPAGEAEPGNTASDSDEAATGGRRRRRGRRGGRGRRGNGSAPAANDAPLDGGDGAAGDAPAAGDDELDTGDGFAAAAHDEAEPASEQPAAPEDDAERPAAEPPASEHAAQYPEAFRELGISDRSLESVARMGFEEPTPVQAEAIPLLLAGRDVVGVAQTGTGKTLAFGIPMMERLDQQGREVQGIVMVPTRELAQQVLEVLTDLARPFGLDVVGLLGGRRLDHDFAALERHPQVVVGTPGRVIDHLGRRTLSLRGVRCAVLDEADQMLDIGFMPDITRILSRTPRRRQTSLFSATMPMPVMRLVKRFMEDPITVAVAEELATVDSVDQVYFEVARRDKVRGLKELIDRELRGRTLVFCRTKRAVDMVSERLQGLGVSVGALHGDMEQRRRDRVVERFRGGDLDILIATNVAARGLDIPEITHVVNFDVPQNAEEYVHRIGRTGRAGREGRAITFVSEADVQEFDVIHERFSDLLHEERLELYA